MPEQRSKFVEKILDTRGAGSDGEKSFTSERQHTAQAFNLHVERRDGRHSEGFAWSHYVGYRWTDEGSHEILIVVFGTRAVEIEGHNLGVLVADIREGQLNGIKELTSRQGQLLQHEGPDTGPVITAVKTYPDFEEIVKEIKGDDERETRDGTGFAGRVGR
jgi:hypothetical protein